MAVPKHPQEWVWPCSNDTRRLSNLNFIPFLSVTKYFVLPSLPVKKEKERKKQTLHSLNNSELDLVCGPHLFGPDQVGLFSHFTSTCQLCLASSPTGPGLIVPPLLLPPHISIPHPTPGQHQQEGVIQDWLLAWPIPATQKPHPVATSPAHISKLTVPLPVENGQTWSTRETHVPKLGGTGASLTPHPPKVKRRL